MSDSFTAACIQMNSGDSVANNLARAAQLLSQAADGGAQLAALPEFFPILSGDETRKLQVAETDGDGPIQNFLSGAAARHRMYIVGGAIPITAPSQSAQRTASQTAPQKIRAACLLHAPDGSRLARYDKMHLFCFQGKTTRADETATIESGDAIVAVDTPLGRIGLSICYDLRFPELYRAMQADILVAPSAFTVETGAAHWELLLRARAVENMAHLIAPAQVGVHPGGRTTYGHSQIIDSWGQLLATAGGEDEAVIFARIDAEERRNQRTRLPALSHRKLRAC